MVGPKQFAAERGGSGAGSPDRAPLRSPSLGAYVEAVQSGSLLFLSRKLSIKGGKPQYVGRLARNSMQMLAVMLCEPRPCRF